MATVVQITVVFSLGEKKQEGSRGRNVRPNCEASKNNARLKIYETHLKRRDRKTIYELLSLSV